VAAVTEMLLHSHAGTIRVFPALPDPDADAEFHRLRAMGAHLVSSQRTNGQVRWIRIESLAGQPATVANPWWPKQRATAFQDGNRAMLTDGTETVALETRRGATYVIVPDGVDPAVAGEQAERRPPVEPRIHEARNVHGHHLWIGRSGDTRVMEAVEAFLGPTWIGNQLQRKHCPYRFDFGVGLDPHQKELDRRLPPPISPVQRPFVFRVTPRTAYHPNRRYGWIGQPEVRAADHRTDCPLRRDCISGRHPATFRIDLEPGLYEMLFVVGAPESETWTQIELTPAGPVESPRGDLFKPGVSQLPGRFETPILSVQLAEATSLDVLLTSALGHRIPWSVAAAFVRMLL